MNAQVEVTSPAPSRSMRLIRSRKVQVAAIVIVGLLVAAGMWLHERGRHVYANDARVAGDVIAARFPADMITAWTEVRGTETHLCIPDDLGFPIASRPLRSVRRG